MAKIIKYNSVNIDVSHTISLELPSFEMPKNEEPEKDEENEPLNEEEARNMAEKILQEAEIKAKNIIYNAEQESRKITKKAKVFAEAESKKLYEEKKKKGYDDGYDAGRKEAEKIKQEAREYSEETKIERKRTMEEIEPSVIKLALKTAENILSSAAAVNPDVVACLIKKGLSDVKLSGDIFIHVPEKHYAEIVEKKAELGLVSDTNTKIEVIKDISLKDGDCIIETPFGNVECGIDVQFKAIKDNMMYILSK